jgi:hypothetical protein
MKYLWQIYQSCGFLFEELGTIPREGWAYFHNLGGPPQTELGMVGREMGPLLPLETERDQKAGLRHG